MTQPAAMPPAPLSRRLASGPSRDTGWLLITTVCWLFALAVIIRMVWWTVPSGLADLAVYRSGALAVLHDRPLYSMRTPQGLPFTYPPVSAILAVPLALVPLRAAEFAWAAMVYVPLAVVIWVGFRDLLQRAGPYRPAAFAVLFGCCAFLVPVEQVMSFGQIDLFLVALCLLDCCARRPWWPRGMLIGLAAAVKLEPGVFVIYLLITGRRKAAAVAAGSFAALTAATWAIAPRDSLTYWTSAIFHTSRLGGNAAAGNQSLRGMLLRSGLPGHLVSVVWLIIALAVAAGGFAAARACWQRGADTAGVAIVGLLAALLSPVGWIHHLCWIVVAIGVLVGPGRDWRRDSVAAATFGLFLFRLPTWAQASGASQPELVRRLLEDSFGLAALCLIALIFALAQPGLRPVIQKNSEVRDPELRGWQGHEDPLRGNW
jgi:alpha-1,2-mannosyltransferase